MSYKWKEIWLLNSKQYRQWEFLNRFTVTECGL